MEYRLAKFISYLFHPMMMPLLAVLCLEAYTNFAGAASIRLHLFIFCTTGFIPLIFTFFLQEMGHISSIKLESRNERHLPFLVALLFYAFCFIMLNAKQIPFSYTILMLGATISVGLAFVVNLFWKISIHMIGAGGLVGAVMGISELSAYNMKLALITAVIIAGLVGYSRLKLGAHRQAEVYVGMATGFVAIYGTVLIGTMG